MKIHCLLKTSVYRGDHADPATHAITIDPEMTVRELVERHLSDPLLPSWPNAPEPYHEHKSRGIFVCDWIELRAEPDPELPYEDRRAR